MNNRIAKTALASAIALTITACGGSGGDVAGIGGSGFISSGTITGFGSVFVNGVKFETDTAEFEIEGKSGGPELETELSEGMRVKVSGTVNADGLTGTATKVEFEDQLEGPISSAFTEDADMENKTFTVLGVTVSISSADTVFVGTNFDYDLITSGDNIQISGFFDETSVLKATAVVEKDAFVASSTIVEAKGTISNLTADKFTLTIGSATPPVTLEVLAGSTDFTGLDNGQFVEVKGTITTAGGASISATLVKLENNNPAEGAEVEIEGIITDFVDATKRFNIDGITVDASALTPSNTTPSDLVLRDGIKVEVEGPINNSILQARTLKLREGNVRVYAPALNVNTLTNTFQMTVSDDTTTVTINTSTQLEDKLDNESFADAVAKLDGNFLRVRGIDDGTGNGIIATRIRIDDPDDDVILQGVVDSKDPGNNSVTVLGITVEVNGTTEFKDINNAPFPGSRTDFFNSLDAGITLIKIKDKDIDNENDFSDTDGIADEIELQQP